MGRAADAACTIPATSLASGQTSVCSGSFIEESYTFGSPVLNATIINNGDWQETGELQDPMGAAVIGPSSSTFANYTGLTIVNNGSVTWTDASALAHPLVSDRTISVIGTFYETQSAGNVTYINNGSILGTAAATPIQAFIGIGMTSMTGTLYAENAGTVSMDGSQITSAAAVVGVLGFAGDDTTLTNKATISIVGGPRTAEGMDYSFDTSYAGYVAGIAVLENSGSISVSATSGRASGMVVDVLDSLSTPTLSAVTITNANLIDVNSVSGTASGLHIASNVANVPVQIFNSGTVRSNQYSLLATPATLAPIYLQNTGTMMGDILTARGDDRLQIWGLVAGSISVADGSDASTFYPSASLSQITLLDGGDDIYAADGYVDTLTFSGGTRSLDPTLLQNWESVVLAAGAVISFSGTDLLVGGGTDGGGNQLGLIVDSGSTMRQAESAFTVTGDVYNAGTVDLANSSVGDSLTVALDPMAPLGASGNYIGAGGVIALDARLGTDGSPADKLIIDGGMGIGYSRMRVANVGGPGALTVADGILVVDAINGATTAPGLFALAAPVVAGPYEYSLYRGSVDASSPDAWYLRSELDCTWAPAHPLCGPDVPDYRPETSLYAAAPAMALLYGRLMLDTLHERRGDELVANEGAPEAAWGRVIGQHGDRDGSAAGIYGSGPKYDYDFWAFQGGVDLYRDGDAATGRNRVGAFFAIGNGSGDVQHIDYGKAGSNSFTAYSWGAYWTHYTPDNAYLDSLLLGSWYDVDAKSNRLDKLTTEGAAFGASIEGGYPLMTLTTFRIEPQAQLAYQTINLHNASDVGAQVHFDDVNSLVGRLGVRFVQDFAAPGWIGASPGTFSAWVRPNLWYEFLGDPKTSFSSATGFIPFAADLGGTTFEINTGFTADIGGGAAIYADASYLVGLGDAADGNAYDGKLGAKVAW